MSCDLHFGKWDRWYRVRRDAGGAMVEVLVAFVLTLLLMESLLQLLLMGMNGIVLAGGKTTACTYAESLLEEMKVRPELLNGLEENETVPAAELAFSITAPEGNEAYLRLITIDSMPTLCQVKLQVYCKKGSRQWQENLVGVVLKPSVQD